MKILITGVAGGDGSIMSEFLLKKFEKVSDFQIYGLIRRSSTASLKNLKNVIDNPKFKIVKGDITDYCSLENIIQEIRPDYFLNFAANTSIPQSWNTPIQVLNTNFLSIINCLEIIRKNVPKCRFLSLGSTEEFGEAIYTPQDEKHPLSVRSIYGLSKASAHLAVKLYREKYNLYCVHAICANHESQNKGEEFVSRIITKGVARIYHQLKNNEFITPIKLGNLNGRRDFSHVLDFCDGFWRMLNQDDYNCDINYDLTLIQNNRWDFLVKNIKDYVLASGKSHSVREFLEKSFEFAGINVYKNDESEEIKINEAEYYLEENNLAAVIVDKTQFRPQEEIEIVGDSKKIKQDLEWEPVIDFDNIVKMMIDFEIKNYKNS